MCDSLVLDVIVVDMNLRIDLFYSQCLFFLKSFCLFFFHKNRDIYTCCWSIQIAWFPEKMFSENECTQVYLWSL